MDTEEYHALDAVERRHWFYRGKRDIVRHWIGAYHGLEGHRLLVDVGAGCGQFVGEMQAAATAVGCERSPIALGIAGGKASRLVCSTAESIPVASDRAAVVTSLDVLEHLDDDKAAFEELVRITRPGGLIVVNVPAFMALWSDWDHALGHKRRYVKKRFLELVDERRVSVLRCEYTNGAIFLPMLVYRLLRTRLGLFKGGRLEDRVPSAPVNELLYRLFLWSACARWLRLPFGTSLLVVLKKRG